MTVFDPAAFSIEPNARRLEKPWGYEVLLSPADAPYTAKLIHVRAGKRLSLQLHDTKVETQTLVAGRGLLVLEGSDGELHEIEMEPGLGYHVAVGQRHRLCAAPDRVALVARRAHAELRVPRRADGLPARSARPGLDDHYPPDRNVGAAPGPGEPVGSRASGTQPAAARTWHATGGPGGCDGARLGP